MDKTQPPVLDLRGIGWFVVLAFAVAWLVELPMLLDGRGVNSPWAILYPAINFAPAIATLVVVRWIQQVKGISKLTGLRLGVPGSRWGLYLLFGWLGFAAFGIAAPFVGALFGLFPMDLTDFSLYRESLQNAPGGEVFLRLGSMQTVVLVGLLTLPLWALLLTPFSLGEELGWRGYLLPKLLPLGQWPALLMSGAIWGLWHAPLIVLGVNYPGHPVLGILLMTINCVIVGTILGWTRLATGSIWPAVLGHAGFNASVGAAYVFGRVGVEYDQAQVTLAGWTGWILPLLFIGLLVLSRRLPVRNAPDRGPQPLRSGKQLRGGGAPGDTPAGRVLRADPSPAEPVRQLPGCRGHPRDTRDAVASRPRRKKAYIFGKGRRRNGDEHRGRGDLRDQGKGRPR